MASIRKKRCDRFAHKNDASSSNTNMHIAAAIAEQGLHITKICKSVPGIEFACSSLAGQELMTAPTDLQALMTAPTAFKLPLELLELPLELSLGVGRMLEPMLLLELLEQLQCWSWNHCSRSNNICYHKSHSNNHFVQTILSSNCHCLRFSSAHCPTRVAVPKPYVPQ